MSVLIAPLSDVEDGGLAVREDETEASVSHAPDEREAARTHALRLLYAAEAAPSYALPILATAGDVREVVRYLKKKPAGVSIVEALDDVKRRVFEPRKIAAYEFWGIVEREGGDRLRLSRLGWEFARRLAPESEAYRAVLCQTAPYRAALEWMQGENQDLVTHTQVAAYWQKFYPSGAGRNQKTIESSVVSFFHLCQAAGIGTMTIGKRGQPARLRVERDELDAFVEACLSPDATTQSAATRPAETELLSLAPSSRATLAPSSRATLAPSSRATLAPPRAAEASQQTHVLILCHGAASRVVGQLQVTLELLDIESRAVVGSETDALPLAGEMFEAMRQCDAALVVVTPEDCLEDGAGGCALKQNILIELNSAFVLYDRRIALVWNCLTPLPGALSSLPHLTLAGDELTWDAGAELMRVVKEFQARAVAGRREG
jgi:hypothetical protein